MKPSRLFSCGLVLLAIMLPPSDVPGEPGFPVPELFGHPTDSPVALNLAANAAIGAYFQYRTESGNYPLQTNTVSSPAGEPLKAVLGGLQSGTLYYYRLVYRKAGTLAWTTREEHSFITRRPTGATFRFTITSDQKGGKELQQKPNQEVRHLPNSRN